MLCSSMSIVSISMVPFDDLKLGCTIYDFAENSYFSECNEQLARHASIRLRTEVNQSLYKRG